MNKKTGFYPQLFQVTGPLGPGYKNLAEYIFRSILSSTFALYFFTG